ncbi:MAG: 4Fe-4S dicluster domain-containing protein [Desulfobacterales bacterium]|nr:MAG: 4Fe-4S dicluster domain-containing protein [Desulfobacterales bacterium]
MALQIIEKSDLAFFVQNLMDHFQLEGVQSKGQSVYGQAFFYGTIRSPAELCLDFDCTVMPPKKYFLPPQEALFRFQTGPSPACFECRPNKPLVIFGIHPYDLKAISQMDRVFAAGTPDPHYLARREATILIGIDPTHVAPRSFWASMEAAVVSSGFDLMMTDLGANYIVETGSEKGKALLGDYAKVRPATSDEVRQRVSQRSHIADMGQKRGLTFPKREIPILLQHSLTSPLWEENATKCLSCGTCNLVCPTCYCFDVWDDMELNLTQGQRLRRWDGCLLSDFARVATGENFRGTRTSRYRHRFYRKGQYLFFGILDDVACVGCGRCAAFCLPDIADPVEVFNRLKEKLN